MLFMHITNPFLLQIKCPLGLHFLNPNKASEMAQILEDIQTKYVPTHNGNETDAKIIQRIFFDGDQLTEERARNCQWANTLAETAMDRLDGITPAFADWHLKKNLLGVGSNSKLTICCPNAHALL